MVEPTNNLLTFAPKKVEDSLKPTTFLNVNEFNEKSQEIMPDIKKNNLPTEFKTFLD